MRLGASMEATVAVDDRGVIVAWNPAAEKLLGRLASEAIGMQCHEVMHGKSPAGAPICQQDCAIVQLCREGRAARRYEMIARRPDGSELWLDVTSVTVFDDGRPVAVHVLTESVTSSRLTTLAEDVARRLTAGHTDEGDKAAAIKIRQALTKRELEVLQLLAAGLDTDSIAGQLGLTRATVRNHVQNLLPKIGAHTRIEAAVLALKAGLVHLH
ncbi:MAG TPA: LuxR C-terminal-related transcriptional regulator [Candidatus Tumulicola sp.]|nr:LuxR C-terminal-related transcriptional regulator [Candidatus Tumulicola sp.]